MFIVMNTFKINEKNDLLDKWRTYKTFFYDYNI